jgi:NAD(P)-dependent dehydrogenase (short-subunit alcohol dehydrogenase family)
MSLPWILTTPASRGIGLELTRRLLKTTNLPIVATARTDVHGAKSRILEGLNVDKGRLEVLELDVTSNSLLPEQF